MAEPALLHLLGPDRNVLLDGVPHAKAIGMELVEIKAREVRLRVPYDPKLVGNPETGVIHGGVITTLLDNACGIAVFAALEQATSIATLDLRIDYMRAATPGLAVLAHAECYKIGHAIAFVRGVAYHDDPAQPIATAAAAFMLAANKSHELRRGKGTRGAEAAVEAAASDLMAPHGAPDRSNKDET